MPRLSCNQLSTFRWAFEEDLHHYREAGFRAIGLWRRKLADFGLERGMELLQESGLAVSSLTWAGGFTGIDGRTSRECIADAAAAVRLAKQVGAGCLVIYSGGRNGHTLRHADRLLRSALDELLPLAESLGVTLAVKPMHPACAAEWTFLTSLEDTVELIARYGSQNLGMVFDSYQFPLQGEGLRDLADLTPVISLVQLADASTPHGVDLDRCPLGEGRVPVEPIVRTLLDAGYEGYFDVEIMGPSVEAVDYAWLLRQTRSSFDGILSRSSAPAPLVGGPRD